MYARPSINFLGGPIENNTPASTGLGITGFTEKRVRAETVHFSGGTCTDYFPHIHDGLPWVLVYIARLRCSLHKTQFSNNFISTSSALLSQLTASIYNSRRIEICHS
jgi:hypothetical protein